MGSSKSRRRLRRRPGRKRPGGLERLRKRVRDTLGDDGVRFAKSADGIKMSEVLGEFVQPYLKYAETEEGYRKLMTIALVAWNASLLPKESQAEMIDEVLEKLPPEARADGKRIVKGLMRRKQRLFAEYRRAVVDFEVTDLGDAFHLQVASTPENV